MGAGLRTLNSCRTMNHSDASIRGACLASFFRTFRAMQTSGD